MTNRIEVEGRTVEVSRPDKPLFPEDGLTKSDLATYYATVGEVMFPHLVGRPLVMQRFPDGIGEAGFYEKRIPDHFPSWIPRVELPLREGGSITHVVCDHPAVLVYLAQQACITPHMWLARAEHPETPDRMVFDLDPPESDPREAYPRVRWGARTVRGLLDELGLPSFVATTGSRGLHVYVPLQPAWDVDRVRSFAPGVAELLVARHPAELTTAQRKAARRQALFLDVLRNTYGQTVAAPYSVRARPGAPVATPLDWDELGRKGMHAGRYTMQNVLRRLAQRGDPWRDIDAHAARLDEAEARLEELARQPARPRRRGGAPTARNP